MIDIKQSLILKILLYLLFINIIIVYDGGFDCMYVSVPYEYLVSLRTRKEH